MEFIIGLMAALSVCGAARVLGMDRERVFYPLMMIVIASYYLLFAVMSKSGPALMLESIVAGMFLIVAVAGFKKNLWLVTIALAGHGIFDFFHHRLIENSGVPSWWPGFCLTFDVAAGVVLAVLLVTGMIAAKIGLPPPS